MLFCMAGNVVDDDVTVNRIFLVDPVCGLQSAVIHPLKNLSVQNKHNKTWVLKNKTLGVEKKYIEMMALTSHRKIQPFLEQLLSRFPPHHLKIIL